MAQRRPDHENRQEVACCRRDPVDRRIDLAQQRILQ